MVSYKQTSKDSGILRYKNSQDLWTTKRGFKSKKEAMTWYEEFLKSEDMKRQPPRFEKAVEEFITFHVKVYCKSSTQAWYENHLYNHLQPFFGDVVISEIKPSQIQELIVLKQKEGLSNKSINHLLTCLCTLFNYYINNDRVYSNPVKKVRKLKLPFNEMSFLNVEEVNTLLETCKTYNKDFYPLLATAIFSGLRQGELLALTWGDINFVKGTIRVNKSIHAGIVTSPKSYTSIRSVGIPQNLISILKIWKLACPPGELSLVFPSKLGGYKDPRNMVRRHFKPLLSKCGIQEIRFHDLRHTYVSLLISQNTPPKFIQQQVGHSDIKTTFNIYGHLLSDVNEKALDGLNDMFEKASKPLDIKEKFHI